MKEHDCSKVCRMKERLCHIVLDVNREFAKLRHKPTQALSRPEQVRNKMCLELSRRNT